MNKIILIISVALFSINSVHAQIAIGKEIITNPSVSLEFANNENRGIILPYVEDSSAISQNGTFIFDTVDNKVKYLKDGNWFDLSVDDSGVVDLSTQASHLEKAEAKVSIGLPTTTDGILVLEDTNKAMILPMAESPHLNVINPASGMMIYDTIKRQIAVYNGTVWSFWMP